MTSFLLISFFCIQMLLCVGNFFSSEAASQQQWQNYVEGKEKGELFLVLNMEGEREEEGGGEKRR